MIVSIKDRQTLGAIKPTLAVAYLRAKGWTRAAWEPSRYSIWVKSAAGGQNELLLPLDPSFGDFPERMAELLAVLQRVEERSQLSILSDISSTNRDVFRFRADPQTSFLGTMPLEAGALFVGHVKDLLLYAATAEKSPRRASILGKRSDEVTRFMSRALLGQTEVGSFIVRAEVPVPAKITEDLFPERVEPASEPFERKAGVRLMDVLQRTHDAALEALETNKFQPFSELLQVGGSVGLYHTITEAQQVVPSSALDISCSWAPSRPFVGPPPPETVTFEPDVIVPIREAVRILQPKQPVDDVLLTGTVELLQQAAQEELIGELRLNALVEGRPRNVYFYLQRPTYNLAIEAFEERVQLAVRGDLVKEGRFWRLNNPHDIQVLRPDPEPESAEEEEAESDSESKPE